MSRGLGLVLFLAVAAAVAAACSGGGSAPEAGFSLEGGDGQTPLVVEFTDTSEGDVEEWEWDFGDGGTSSEQNPTHEYTEVGSFTVSLTVSNGDGEDQATEADAVTVEPGPVAEVQLEPEDPVLDIGETQTFTVVASDEFGNEIEDVEVEWTLASDSGEIDAEGNYVAGSIAGDYPDEIVAVVEDQESLTTSLTIRPGPIASVQVDPPQVTVALGDEQAFTALVTDEYGNLILDLDRVSWSDATGEIDAGGVLEPVTPGDKEITATVLKDDQEATGTALASVPAEFFDPFDGEVKLGWTWLSGDPEFRSFEEVPGWLTVTATLDTPQSLLRTPFAPEWEIETLLRFAPYANFQHAGLTIQDGEGNSINVIRAFCDAPVCAGDAIYMDNVFPGGIENSDNSVATIPAGTLDVWLRLRFSGGTYTGLYSLDGVNYNEIGSRQRSIDGVIGIQVVPKVGDSETPEPGASFEYFVERPPG